MVKVPVPELLNAHRLDKLRDPGHRTLRCGTIGGHFLHILRYQDRTVLKCGHRHRDLALQQAVQGLHEGGAADLHH